MIYKFNRQAFNRPADTTGYVQLVVRGESSIKIGVQVVRGVSYDAVSLSNVEMSVLRAALPFIEFTSKSEMMCSLLRTALPFIGFTSTSEMMCSLLRTALPFIEFASRSEMRGSLLRTALPFIGFTSTSEMRCSLLRTALPFIEFASRSEMMCSLLRTALPFIGFTSTSEMMSSLLRERYMVLNATSTSQFHITAYGLMSVRTSYVGASRITYRPLAVRGIRPVDYAAHSSFEAAVTRLRYAVVKYSTHSRFEAYPLPTYIEAINDHSRTFTSRVEIYFDGPAAPPITITDTELVSFVLLEELRAQTNTPLGDISANEFEISLYNEDRRFSQANKDSDLYGKLKPGIMLKPYISLVLRGTESLEFELGTFYAGDWVTASTSVVCNTVCYDRLKDIMKIPYDGLRVQTGLTFKELFEIVFTLANVPSTDFNISNELSTVVDKAYIPGNTVGDALKYLAEASGSYVTVDRRNMIQVFKPNYTASPQAILTENNQLFTHTQPTRYLEMYTALDIPYHKTSVRDQELLVHINELEIDVGEFVSEHKLRQVPVSMVNKIDLQGPSGVSLKYYTATAETITLYLDNSTGEKQTISAKVFGTGVDFVEEPVGRDYPDISQLIDKKELRIDNKLLQSKQASDALLDMIEVVTSNPSAHISASIRGDLRVLPGGTVEISDANKKLDKQRVLVTTSTLEYSGAVSGLLEGYVVGGEE